MSAEAKQAIRTEEAPAAIGPYSQAVRAGGWVFVSGQIPLEPATGEMVEGGVREQTRRVLDNLAGVLKACGLDFRDVVKTTVYLKDLSQFGEMNAVYAEAFPTPAPARAAVEVSALPKGALIEIEAVARARGAEDGR
ncbi:MAG: RidA family protein [Elusimicrobiota bacterium]